MRHKHFDLLIFKTIFSVNLTLETEMTFSEYRNIQQQRARLFYYYKRPFF